MFGSPLSQVMTNLESQRGHYDLVEVARHCGFLDVECHRLRAFRSQAVLLAKEPNAAGLRLCGLSLACISVR